MSFVRRSSSFIATVKADAPKYGRSATFDEHDFIFDIEDMHVLKAGGLPKARHLFARYL
jgi:hypothetical protein